MISGNGMCSRGRIVNYLKAMLGDSRHNVVFVGYQAKGTSDAAIQASGQDGEVELEGERLVIEAGVFSMGGYSAHADQQRLLKFVTGMQQWPAEIRLVHGERPAKLALAQALRTIYEQSHCRCRW